MSKTQLQMIQNMPFISAACWLIIDSDAKNTKTIVYRLKWKMLQHALNSTKQNSRSED